MRSAIRPSIELPEAGEQTDFLDVVEKHARVGYWSVDLVSNDVFLSAEACRVHGIRAENSPGSLAELVDLYCPRDRERVSASLVHAMLEAETFAYEARVITPADDTRWVSVSGEARCDDEGSAISIVGVLRDITDERQIKEKLNLALTEANSARRLKDTFLANMSHELRTPLNAIIGFSQLINIKSVSGDVTEQVGEYATDIANAGAHLLTIIEDMFSLAQMEAGAANIVLKPVSAEMLLEDARSLTGALASQSNKVVDFGGSAFAECKIIVDRDKMTKILVSLISNAVKYSPPGAPVRVDAEIDEGGRLVFSVTDRGPGIPEHLQDKVFERFERLGACKEAIPGIGVGLAIARELVTLMKGEIGLISREGEGSTFWIAFDVEDQVERSVAV